MIKIETEFKDLEFNIKLLEHAHSCSAEALCVISAMIDQIEKFGGIKRKEIYKIIKDFDTMWINDKKEI